MTIEVNREMVSKLSEGHPLDIKFFLKNY